jgi:hypothetical protein
LTAKGVTAFSAQQLVLGLLVRAVEMIKASSRWTLSQQAILVLLVQQTLLSVQEAFVSVPIGVSI